MKKHACPIPTTLQLASIAAQLLNHQNGDAAGAVAKAVSVWEACASEIEAWPHRIAQRKAETDEWEALKKMQAAYRPTAKSEFEILIRCLDFRDPAGRTKSEPVSFKKALGWIMRNVSPGERLVRFRKALMIADGVDNFKAGGYIAQLEKRKWFIEQHKTLAGFFDRHWQNHLSRERSKAGKQRGSKDKTKTS